MIIKNKAIEKLLDENKSFCLHPFATLLVLNGQITPCCYTLDPVVSADKFISWNQTAECVEFRNNLLKGQPVKQCAGCYSKESTLGTSPRIEETLRLARELKITNITQVSRITKPKYYQIRANNLCNLKCRMCIPLNSNLIKQEYIKLGLHDPAVEFEYTGFELVDIDTVEELFVAGGEPLIQKEFVEFLEQCVALEKTQYHLVVNTNAVSYNQKIFNLLSQFSNLHLQFSLDGFGPANDYIRWPSKWGKVIHNIKELAVIAKSISFNVTVSIYNIFGLYELLKFLEENFPSYPNCLLSLSLVHSENDMLSSDLYPNKQQVKENLSKCKELHHYSVDPAFRSMIDKLIESAETTTNVNLVRLKKFFEFNDLLDQSRAVQLNDYLPELDKFRHMVLQ
jgi:sulfatase maturation enzyme AslB (radical SAM superfamily)